MSPLEKKIVSKNESGFFPALLLLPSIHDYFVLLLWLDFIGVNTKKKETSNCLVLHCLVLLNWNSWIWQVYIVEQNVDHHLYIILNVK